MKFCHILAAATLFVIVGILGLSALHADESQVGDAPETAEPAPRAEPTYDGKPLSELLEQLRSDDADARRKAIVTLEEHIGPEGKAAVPDLAAALKDKHIYVSSRAARALGKIGPAAEAAVPDLIAVLKGGSESLTLPGEVAGALADIGPEAAAEAMPVLAEIVKQGPIDFGVYLGALQEMGPPAVPAIVDILRNGDDRGGGLVGAFALDALGEMGADARAAVPALAELLAAGGKDGKEEDRDPWRLGKIADTLAEIGPDARDAIPALLRAARDRSTIVRQAAAHALYKIDPAVAQRENIARPLVMYEAFIQTDEKTFHEERLSVGGGAIGGRLVLWVNGDPIGFYDGGGSMMPLNRWLLPGRNELTFSGQHDKPVYVLVAKSHMVRNALGLAGKKAFEPSEAGAGDRDLAEPLTFDVEPAPDIPTREELSDRLDDRARYEEEIRALLSRLRDLIRAHEGAEAAGLLMRGHQLWGAGAFGESEAEVKARVDQLAKSLADPELKPIDEEPALRLLFGKRLVLAYAEPAGGDDDAREPTYVLAVERAGKRGGVGWLQLARVNGEWVVWHIPTSIGFRLSSK